MAGHYEGLGPPAQMEGSFFGSLTSDGYYGLTPTLHHQDDYLGADASSFVDSFLAEQHHSPPADLRPQLKRGSTSDESATNLSRPDLKRTRIELRHTDTGTSNASAQSTATSNGDSGASNHASPHSDVSPAPDTRLEQSIRPRRAAPPIIQPALPRTSAGQTPSVLLPALPSAPSYQDHPMFQYAQQARAAARQAQQQGSFQRLTAQEPLPPLEPIHATRRSKAAAMQHLEEVEVDEPEDDDATSPMPFKGKAGNKRQPRKKAGAKSNPVKEQPMVLDDDNKSMDGDEDKRAQFLERNRLAACKSRQKKKEWIKSLEVQSDDLARQNGDLQVLVTALRDEIGSLRSALAAHAQCSCRLGPNSMPSQHMPVAPQAPQLDVGGLPQSADAATYVAAPWVGMGNSPTDMQKDMMHAQTPGVIDFHAHQPSGITPFLQSTAADADYFTQSFGPPRPALNTPELARSLGYAS